MNKGNLIFLLKCVIAIFIVSLIMDRVVFYTLSAMEKKVMSGLGIGKLNRFFAVKDSADFLVLGNSRAAHSIDNGLINSNSFNIGVDGTSILYSNILVRTLENSKPQLLLFQIDPELLFDDDYIGTDAERLKAKDNIPVIKKYLTDNDLYNPFQRVYRSLAYNNLVFPILSNFLRPSDKAESYYGYDPLVVSEKEKDMFRKSIENISTTSEVECTTGTKNELVMKCLADLKAFCLERNKRIVFFTAPVFSDPCKDDNKAISALMKQMNLSYLDYSDYFKSDSSLTNWKDLTHLSNIGAKKFTEEIRKSLIGAESGS